MDGMTPAHAKPARKNHLWVLFAIAFPAAVEVWASWVGVGSRSGFPVIRLPFGWPAFSTGFSLAVGMEAYWGYALYVWLAAGAGPRSRKFAMQSAIGAFTLSLLGQIAYHLMLAEHVAATPVIVVVFVAALPVTLLALVAFLIHLMHADRQAAGEAEGRALAVAAEAEREASGASELDALRAELEAFKAARDGELETLMSDLEAERAARETAQRETAEALTRAEILAKKLAAKSAQKPRKGAPESAQDEDLTLEFRALDELQKNPALRKPRMGGELARRLGVSPATGRRLHGRLTAQDRSGQSLTDRSPDAEDERSGERS
jgi:hypothetical protein